MLKNKTNWILLSLLLALSCTEQTPKRLPFLGNYDVSYRQQNGKTITDTIYQRIPDFSFFNEDSVLVTKQNFAGKVWISEFFFASCPSICPIMNTQMQRIQRKFATEEDVRIFSFTVDPDTDTIAQMKRYATAHRAKAGQWHFLTGKKADLYGLARRSFFVLKPAEAQNLGDAGSDFIHTNNFVLVDQQLRIRGYYDGTNPKEVSLLQAHIAQLLNAPQ